MSSTVRRLFASVVVAIFSVCASQTAPTQGITEKPSAREIRDIEPNVEMPHGADSIAKYFRFYYVKADSPGWIYGMYVAKHYFSPSDSPVEEIVVVDSSVDIPAPYDAGCDVVFVSYDVQNNRLGATYCADSLSL